MLIWTNSSLLGVNRSCVLRCMTSDSLILTVVVLSELEGGRGKERRVDAAPVRFREIPKQILGVSNSSRLTISDVESWTIPVM